MRRANVHVSMESVITATRSAGTGGTPGITPTRCSARFSRLTRSTGWPTSGRTGWGSTPTLHLGRLEPPSRRGELRVLRRLGPFHQGLDPAVADQPCDLVPEVHPGGTGTLATMHPIRLSGPVDPQRRRSHQLRRVLTTLRPIATPRDASNSPGETRVPRGFSLFSQI